MDTKIRELKEKIAKLEREVESAKKRDRKEKDVEKKEKFVPLKILLRWTAPSRVFVPRDKAWFLKVATVALLFILFFAFLQDFIVILVICIVVLIAFLLASIPPDKVEHQITSRGIRSMDKLYKWKDLTEFWIAERLGHKILYIETKLGFPTRLMMIFKSKDEMKVVSLLLEKIDLKESDRKQSWLSRLSDGEMVNPDKYLKSFKRQRKSKRRKTKGSEK